jgi:hypothetical protein
MNPDELATALFNLLPLDSAEKRRAAEALLDSASTATAMLALERLEQMRGKSGNQVMPVE